MTRYAVALGSNQGDRVGHLRAAVGELGRLGEVEKVAGLYETEPVGGPEQDPFLNSMVVLDSDLSPEELLDGLQEIENAHGRVREVRWGPRTLDLDIVAMEAGPVDRPRLSIPHPEAINRRFVLEPLAGIWPEAEVAPGRSASTALDAVVGQQVDMLAADWVESEDRKDRYWVLAQAIFVVAIGVALVTRGSAQWSERTVIRVVGGILVVGGAVVVAWASRALGQNLSAFPTPPPGGHLVDTGPYARVRHPIYSGLVLGALGISLLVNSMPAAGLSLSLLVFFWVKADHEEKTLRIAYPGYSAYRERVKHGFVPHLF